MTEGWLDPGELIRVGGCQRSKRSLIVDIVPWFGKIWNGNNAGRKSKFSFIISLLILSSFTDYYELDYLAGAQQFLNDLGVFPPPPSGTTLAGEAIGEREVGEDDEDELEAEANAEVDGEEDEYVEVDMREEVAEVEELFDPNDDIVDSD